MATAMLVAGALDYAVNIIAGRRLEPVEFGVFVTVTGLLQIALTLSMAIRSVVAFYAAGAFARADASIGVGDLVRVAWRWALRWGAVSTLLLALASAPLARWLRLPSVWPLLAAAPMLLMLFVREATLGAAQGIQEFGAFGLNQVAQAVLRVVLVAALVAAGGRAAGAIFAQPLAAAGTLAIAAWPLRQSVRGRTRTGDIRVSWHYSAHTLVGLGAFGGITALDALFVKAFYSPSIAGDYAPVVTFAKICLFLPMAAGLVLFAKVARRRAAGLDPRPILLLAMGVALAPGLVVSSACFLYPGALVAEVFGGRYSDPGVVLGLVTLAATLYSGIHIWLNYALSSERNGFPYILMAVLVGQGAGMVLVGRESLVRMALAMVCAGVIGNVAGYLATWSAAPVPRPRQCEAVADGG
jgi:O-antigen/teichoic acid export membrane protein